MDTIKGRYFYKKHFGLYCILKVCDILGDGLISYRCIGYVTGEEYRRAEKTELIKRTVNVMKLGENPPCFEASERDVIEHNWGGLVKFTEPTEETS